MKKYEIYIDINGRLSISEFKRQNSQFETLILKGRDTFEKIKILASKSLVDFYLNKKKNHAILEYKNYVVNISDFDEVINKRGIGPFVNNIKRFKETESLKQIKPKKVQRKNKYIKTRIIATGLTLAIIGSCAANLLKQEPKFSEEIPSTTYSISNEIDNNDVEIITTKIEENKQQTADLIAVKYEDRSETSKAKKTEAYYGDMINKYAKMYGIDSKLALAVATQERGIHSSITDKGGATGLMQIQNSAWIGEKLTAYNFETKKTETFIVTLDKIKDVEYNIKYGCMILQTVFNYMDYNPIAALQCYNMGYGNMMKILNAYSKDSNKTVKEILENHKDTKWLNYRNLIKVGDQEYVEHVLSWIGNEVEFKNLNQDGSIITTSVIKK